MSKRQDIINAFTAPMKKPGLSEWDQDDLALARDLLLDDERGIGAEKLDHWPAAKAFITRVMKQHDITLPKDTRSAP